MSVDAYNDITPRFGVAYDVFGNGKTAVKFNMGHYLDAATNDSAYTRNNPANRIVSTYDRGWTDSDNDKVVDCNLLVLTANGECAGADRQQPELRRRLGQRHAGQSGHADGLGRARERLAVGRDGAAGSAAARVGGSRLRPPLVPGRDGHRQPEPHARTDYDSYVVTAPSDSRLPGGGGYPIRIYVPNAATPGLAAQNYITFETDFGPERTNYWHGVDFTLNARTRWGLTFSGGTSTGRSVTDDCATTVLIDSPDPRNCRDVDPFQTTLRGLASYTIPKIDVLVSGTVRSQPAGRAGRPT